MTAPPIVIIGCGAGGGTTAQFARKTNRTTPIVILEKGKYPQYSKCGLPYVLSGEIPHFDDLIEFSQEWFTKEQIDLHLATEVTTIDIKNHILFVKKEGKQREQSFDKLILATGGTVSLPSIQNIMKNNTLLEGVCVLRTIDDAKHILSQVKKGKKATVVGAGLIGLELADVLVKKGLNVTVVEALPSILAHNLDSDLANLVQTQLLNHVTLYTNHFVIRVEEHHHHVKYAVIQNRETKDEVRISTDLFVIATGVKPEISLARQIGCAIGSTGAIRINEKTETSVKDVYAVGDCTEYKDFVTNKPVGIGLGSIVVRQGIAAGTNAAGGIYTLPKGVLQTWTSKFFDIEIAGVGPLDEENQSAYVNGKFTGASHPSYFPGGKPITMKIKSHPDTGRILAAQAVGANAALRINTLACAILNHSSLDDIRKLETAYAPPVAPTLDTLTLVCDVAYMKHERKKRSP